MKFSIIIPVYNVEQYIAQCLNSVLGQTWSDFEVIVVDDGSTDNSAIICERYVEQDKRIKLIKKENGGLSSARNAGLQKAKGEYIYFLDSDDFIRKDLLEVVREKMDSGYDMVSFSYTRVSDSGNHIDTWSPKVVGDFSFNDNNERLSFLLQIVLKGRIAWSACIRVFRKSVLDEYLMYFEDNKRIFAEDLYFMACYTMHLRNISIIDEPLYYYRDRYGSIMKSIADRPEINRKNELSKAVLSHIVSFKELEFFEQYFSTIHFVLFFYNLESYLDTLLLKKRVLSAKKLKELVLKEIEDIEFFSSYLDQSRLYNKELELCYGKKGLKMRHEVMNYILNDNAKNVSLRTRIYFLGRIERIVTLMKQSGFKKLVKKLLAILKNGRK